MSLFDSCQHSLCGAYTIIEDPSAALLCFLSCTSAPPAVFCHYFSVVRVRLFNQVKSEVFKGITGESEFSMLLFGNL